MRKRGLFSSKKGEVNEELFFFIAELILTVMVFVILLAYVNSIRDNTLLEKNYLARDVALMVDSVYAAPGKINVGYSFGSIDLLDFSFGFNEQRAGVLEENGEQTIKFPYADNKIFFSPLSIGFMRTGELIFIRSSNRLRIGGDIKENLNKIDCPVVETKEDKKRMIIDAGHGGSDSGFVNTNDALNESKITQQIARVFGLYMEDMKDEGFFVEFTRDVRYDSERPMDKRLLVIGQSSSNILISMHVGEDDEEINNIKAFVPFESKKSVKLACNIINSLLDEYDDITGASIIPSEDIILQKPVSVLLELGNIQADKDILNKKDKTALSIIDGIKDYFE
ncbi:N-acetylmuramoyl-L-alanine amidase [Candidatus Woesearchaeota archaeon]|nr:N-acetylmuramoyl-L-alanine amidase [Candidatus Woesearchaeota archaeon]